MSEEIPWPTGHVAILYSDLEGSTATAGRLHDAAYDRQVKHPFYQLLLAKIAEYRGRVFQDKGDGVIAVFQSTRAAALMAADLQQVLAEQDLPRVRIGIHTSVAALNLPDSGAHPVHPHLPNYGTEDLSFASRIEYVAEGGQVLLSESAQRAYVQTGGEPLPLKEWRGRRLPKVDHAENVYELLYPGRTPKEPGGRFFRSFFVGERNRYVPRPSKERAIQAAFENSFRVVTLKGAGGTGKTRLALHSAVELAYTLNRTLYCVSLADPSSTPETASLESVTRKVGEALGLSEADCDPEGVVQWAEKTEALLVLDNCESVAGSAFQQWVAEIVAADRVRLLLTSRRSASPLDITQDVLLDDGMEPDEAEQLFVETVRRRLSDYTLDNTTERVPFTRILELTDRLPLCIELVAAHRHDTPMADLAESLDNFRLPVLPAGQQWSNTTETFGRHNSLLRCLNWSWRLLSESEQQLLSLCGLFVAPFLGATLATLSQKTFDAIKLTLQRLGDASLVRYDHLTNRYRLHHSTAEYARIRFQERPDTDEYLTQLVQTYKAMLPDDGNYIQSDEIMALRDEWENLLEAHRHAVAQADFETAIHFQQLYRVAATQSRIPDFIELLSATFALTQTDSFQQRDDAAWWQANLQNNLGNAYSDLPSGDRDANLKRAIAAYESALRVYTEDRFPMQWAGTQNNLGTAYSDLPSGDRDANLKRAIAAYESALRVRTEDRFPMQWAGTQNNLGIAYRDLPSGDRDANLKRAIAAYESALRVYTEDRFPMDWAGTQNNLGTAYRDLPSGDRDANLKRAIAAYESALRVYTEDRFLMDWAGTQNNLGTAYSNLPSGDRDANLKRAIAAYESALRVYTEDRFPMDWAGTQNNLGIAYRNLPSGDRDANLKRAIAAYESALRVYTEDRFPMDWAMTQNNLGIAYRNLPSGDRDANLKQAIAAYESALRVYTEDRFPMQWAMTQFNIAMLEHGQGKVKSACNRVRKSKEVFRNSGAMRDVDNCEKALRQWEGKSAPSRSCVFGALGGVFVLGVGAIYGVVRLIQWWLHR